MSNPKVEIYTTPICPYCDRAKRLFDQKGVDYTDLDASDPSVRKEMLGRSGGRMAVPQIFINDHHVGGSDELYDLDRTGKLDDMLGAET